MNSISSAPNATRADHITSDANGSLHIGHDKSISLSDIARNVNNCNLDEEVLVFDTTYLRNNESKIPHRIDALIILLCVGGSAKLTIDLQEYELRPDAIMVLQPKNYISVSHVSADFDAKIIACSHRVVEDVLPKLTDILPLLMHHRASPVSHIEHADELKGYYEFLKHEIGKPKSVFQKKKVMCLLQAALFELMDIQSSMMKGEIFVKSRKEELMAKFIIAVSENFRDHRQVAFYARELCITPKHLSSVVKQISGRTAGEWIENYVSMEAKVLLKTTDLTIQEIASRLHFPNQSFFGKYFKHIAGLSPTEFRKQNE